MQTKKKIPKGSFHHEKKVQFMLGNFYSTEKYTGKMSTSYILIETYALISIA